MTSKANYLTPAFGIQSILDYRAQLRLCVEATHVSVDPHFRVQEAGYAKDRGLPTGGGLFV